MSNLKLMDTYMVPSTVFTWVRGVGVANVSDFGSDFTWAKLYKKGQGDWTDRGLGMTSHRTNKFGIFCIEKVNKEGAETISWELESVNLDPVVKLEVFND